MTRHSLIGLILSLPLLGGCFFETYRETQNFDLEAPVPRGPAKASITVRDFENLSGAGQKMRYRIEKRRIVIDNYNKWVQSPEQMLVRYFTVAFANSAAGAPDARGYVLSGTLNSFEIDLGGKQVRIQLACRLKDDKTGTVKWQKEFAAAASFKQDSPVEFAEAASTAARELADQLQAAIAGTVAPAGKN